MALTAQDAAHALVCTPHDGGGATKAQGHIARAFASVAMWRTQSPLANASAQATPAVRVPSIQAHR